VFLVPYMIINYVTCYWFGDHFSLWVSKSNSAAGVDAQDVSPFLSLLVLAHTRNVLTFVNNDHYCMMPRSRQKS